MTAMNKFNVGDRVRVVKAQKPTYWYANKIGEVFTIDEIVDDYMSHEWESYRIKENKARLLQQPDIEIVEDIEKEIGVNKFNVGDKVKCIDPTYRDDWGVGEMVVMTIYDSGLIACNHDMGHGGFFPSQLEHVEKPASLELQKQQLEEQLAEVNAKIAAKKLEDKKKLGEKQVQITLTVNELAWITVNVGQSSNDSTTEEMKNDFYVSEFDFMKSPQDGQHSALYNKLGDLLKQQFD